MRKSLAKIMFNTDKTRFFEKFGIFFFQVKCGREVFLSNDLKSLSRYKTRLFIGTLIRWLAGILTLEERRAREAAECRNTSEMNFWSYVRGHIEARRGHFVVTQHSS